VRHRQTKGAATDMFGLQPPRHTPTLPTAVQPVSWGIGSSGWKADLGVNQVSGGVDSGLSRHNEARLRWTLIRLDGSGSRITQRLHLDGDGPVPNGAARDQVTEEMPMLSLVSSDSHVFEPPDLWQPRR
jgi:hypothetical protein